MAADSNNTTPPENEGRPWCGEETATLQRCRDDYNSESAVQMREAAAQRNGAAS